MQFLLSRPSRTIARCVAATAISCAAISLSSRTSIAQTTQPAAGEGRARFGGGGAGIGPMQEALGDLNLSTDQKSKIDILLEKAKSDIREKMQSSTSASPDEKRASLRETMVALHEQITAVLTDEQKTKFEEKIKAARESATSQPARGGQGAAGQGQRLREMVSQLDLTDDQKQKIDPIMKDAEKQLADLRESRKSGGSDPKEMREKLRGIIESTRTQIEAVLTPDQKEKLQSLMQNQRGGGDRKARKNRGDAPSTQPTDSGTTQRASMDDSMKPTSPAMASNGSTPRDKSSAADASTDATATLAVGEPAPGFTATRIDGSKVPSTYFKNQTLLMLFGSFSSPSFRQRASSFESLRHDFNSRASFLVVYTKEAHPAGGWEVDRNKDNDISIPLATSMADRTKAATETRDRLKLSAPVVLDSMDDAIASAYHATSGDAAVLVGKDGNVLLAQQWFEPYAMRDALMSAIQAANSNPNGN